VPLLRAHYATTCPFTYEEAYINANGLDDVIILSRYPIGRIELRRMYQLNFRTVLFARIDHPMGPVDVFSTHLAAGSDGGPTPCGANCPAECVAAGAATVRECQAVQTAEFIESLHDVATPAVLTGDLNAQPGTFVYQQFVNRGWIDTYLAVGLPECVPATGVGCTSGRIDDDLTHLEDPAANVDVRIDYAFVVPPTVGSCALDGLSDDDGDGIVTRIFADDPNPFAPTCGPAPDPICWPSDHEGMQLDLNCG
jgi:endonuclease/exonuclease/phosphatase family metal-dependent hydrolase